MESESADVIPFPSQLRHMEDLFRFSYDDLDYILNGFNQVRDIKFRLLELKKYISSKEDFDEEVMELIDSEVDIIDFSKESRSSVIHF